MSAIFTYLNFHSPPLSGPLRSMIPLSFNSVIYLAIILSVVLSVTSNAILNSSIEIFWFSEIIFRTKSTSSVVPSSRSYFILILINISKSSTISFLYTISIAFPSTNFKWNSYIALKCIYHQIHNSSRISILSHSTAKLQYLLLLSACSPLTDEKQFSHNAYV